MSDDPVPLADALAEVRAELGLPHDDAFMVLVGRWSEVVGDDVSAHAELIGLRESVVLIAVDSTPWATQLRFLKPVLVARANAVLGREAVRSCNVRVRPTPGAN